MFTSHEQPIYRGLKEADKQSLPPLARYIFSETFARFFDAPAFSDFCDERFGLHGAMVEDFENPHINWRIAEVANELIGYAKLMPLAAPAPNPREGAMELQQIYVLPAWHGTGVAEELMNWSIQVALQHGAPEIYLTVFDHNERAKGFYRRHHFRDVGRCAFVLGGRTYEDRVWRRPLFEGNRIEPKAPPRTMQHE